jgi:prepilin-type N-terminal cleavage/methylation domain-containing protein
MKRVRLSSKIRKACQGRSGGFTLIEVLIALALVGIIAIAFLSALSTASMALITADERATAESLARSQMEYVKNQEYIDYSEPDHEDYDKITNTEGFDIDLLVESIQTGLQKITVTVSRDGKQIITLEDYKRLT